MEPLLVVSPHLDDAVFGCGDALAAHPGSVVLTIFAGRPPAPAWPGPWDVDAGFAPGDDVVGARREEDREALALLGARPVWLDFCDSQYGITPAVEPVAEALEAALRATPATTIVVPLGLFHSDHHVAHDASLAVMGRRPERRWLAYEEPMYRLVPGLVDERLARLRAAGLDPRLVPPDHPEGGHTDGADASARKRRAVLAYRSQIRALETAGRPGWTDALEPERCWELAS